MPFMNPIILNAYRFVKEAPDYFPQRIVLDYEFDLYLNHERKMVINDTVYKVQKNSLVFRKPGQVVRSKGDYDCYILTLSFTDSHMPLNYSRNTAITMQPECDSEILKLIPPVFTPKHSDDIRHLFKKIIVNFDEKGNSATVHNLVMQLLLMIASDCYCTSEVSYNYTQNVVNDICYYLSENYRKEIDLDDLCRNFGYNKSYLIRKFKKETGLSPINYLINLRLDNARLLLENTSYPIAEISYMCGYEDSTFFSTAFKRKFSYSPSTYRTLVKEDKIEIY